MENVDFPTCVSTENSKVDDDDYCESSEQTAREFDLDKSISSQRSEKSISSHLGTIL